MRSYIFAMSFDRIVFLQNYYVIIMVFFQNYYVFCRIILHMNCTSSVSFSGWHFSGYMLKLATKSRRCIRGHNLVTYNFMNKHFDFFYLNGGALPETILLHLVESKIHTTK